MHKLIQIVAFAFTSKLILNQIIATTDIEQFLDGLDKGKEYLIVSHGAYIRAMKSIIETGEMHRMNSIEFQNGEMLSLEW